MLSKEAIKNLTADELFLILRMCIHVDEPASDVDLEQATGWDTDRVNQTLQQCVHKGAVEISNESGQGIYTISLPGLWVETTKSGILKASNEQPEEEPIFKERKSTEKTYCYLMIDRNTDFYKIGCSKNPQYRERTLQSEKPTIDLLHKWPGGYEEERILHEEFSAKRIRGEWFALNEDDVNYIMNLPINK